MKNFIKWLFAPDTEPDYFGETNFPPIVVILAFLLILGAPFAALLCR